ncbi:MULTISPECIES: phosphonate metabolism protein/1,5-bisphosphokinase (PRPP-forming) PhnN [Pseudomonas]|uniref:phosphonate metabolism protein/1,5-bisphosphokinase (PRPP-forming) PhnN n=1 Tax=Pseudomonas TaxID=286 RepID=UPI0018A91858|nr:MULTISPECIES: phosphonate metabolism protein/1,5-bisphosphokinase (PRPP-forming) PhnN [Pseudomonas]MBF8745441.1 phosphonate metabolism protein/1,5-bisphosphokinase (PRPP-forming) PhnN [Pseudomonas monteilii]MCT8166386.1 phosphonate metabolism protein/1,5-bisphosphokinase (PRPP-forming) PhnN [Pseudomonas sp. HD6422]MCT8185228.1 phosphonate metabolism protein/1,5-bisphosphokinase (PRPP-forming) PhnN [Pseudomonas sp. HD6421]
MQHDASDSCFHSARLIFLMGPSGSGKDSLMDAARPRLIDAGVKIARRVITRSAEAKGEAAQGVTYEEFEAMLAAGAFAMHWRANGLDYGIPVQVDRWLEQGHPVLVNGSRAYLTQARQRYPHLLAIRLEVRPEILHQRLLARGRETPAQVAQRLARGASLQGAVDADVYRLDNSDSLETAVEALMDLLRREEVIPT